ncbi:bifunctional hydroxymethylpyrimidine kinase/phosphomethylpyrimidine kinase [Anaerobacillus arseniciselenatis]|uniref:Hydroxymethylpyrimidine/phosphomethylpyrimidine kinase n=1 Tax=Anaerobacillus arseniciselenatis TaxID=85682 RepID=A0A1S2LU88_9BACI|nr:bifunctional hydroxymethylpyrimidine kinase/phosphomethylpyrimidine kinase [Anaerobacillus arseniciselenatis]OIJ16079.1 bifunctional hydroxymethylpyrimidine kinase/phosphomethylpyrimidine kinase [Anaerobacillus arseniciselenatis]
MSVGKALTIAGSDCGGGAGIQADLKTFQERDVYGMSVITVLTAQNTLGVHGVYPQTIEAIEAQLDAIFQDIGTDSVKTGMLFSEEIINLVAKKLKDYEIKNIVIDPVMIAKGGAPLLQKQAMTALKMNLLPLARVITPNIPEACEILGIDKIETVEEMKEAAANIQLLGPKNVVLKGGHLEGNNIAVDILFDGNEYYYFESKRIDTIHTHGTGCTFAAAITAELAKGNSINESVACAKQFIQAAIETSLNIGKGIGPTNHSALRHK